MAQIYVQIIFDAASIINTPPGPGPNSSISSPVGVPGDFIYMVAPQGNVLSGTNGSDELTLLAQTGDEILWQESTLGPDYSVILYQLVASPPGLLSAPTLNETTVTLPLPNLANPTQPLLQTVKEFSWSVNVEDPGTVTYHFNFMVVARDGTVLGYYNWDPFIRISS